MKTRAQVKAMLAKVETTKGAVDGRQEIIMALEWVLENDISTSMSLEGALGEIYCVECGADTETDCICDDLNFEDSETVVINGERFAKVHE